jgi:mRNA interferase MazF
MVRFDPTEGVEISKTRPAVIIQNDVGNRFSDLTIAAPITSKYDAELYQIRAVDKRRLIRRLGALPPSTMLLVNEALAVSVGLADV